MKGYFFNHNQSSRVVTGEEENNNKNEMMIKKWKGWENGVNCGNGSVLIFFFLKKGIIFPLDLPYDS